MNIDVTKLTTDQFSKYYEFVISIMNGGLDQIPDGFYQIHCDVCRERDRRSREDVDLAQRMRPFIAEEIIKHINNSRGR